MNVKWYKYLLIGNSVKYSKWRLKQKMFFKRMPINYYCITLPSNPENLLDIIGCLEFRQPFYKDKTIYILGIASSKVEAMEMVAKFLSNRYEETKVFKIDKAELVFD